MARTVERILQDYDTLVQAHDGTSLLTKTCLLGEKKTHAMARGLRGMRGSDTLQERRFAANFQVAPDEPGVALCGVANVLAQAALEGGSFRRFVEVGLGTGLQDYPGLHLPDHHRFPGA